MDLGSLVFVKRGWEIGSLRQSERLVTENSK